MYFTPLSCYEQENGSH